MKLKHALFLIILFNFIDTKAQGLVEALRYSNQGLSGSSRSIGSANAYGAVGGDLICGLINPAGLALLRKSDLHFGLNINSNTTKSSYINSTIYDDANVGVGLSNVGLTISGIQIENNGKIATEGLTNVVFSFSYNRHSDYRTAFNFTGTNKLSSFTDYLAEKANGQVYTDMNTNSLGYLAFQSYLIEPQLLRGYDDSFSSAYATNNTNVSQTSNISRSGSGGDYNISLAGDWNNQFYFGGGLVIRSQRFTELQQFKEKDLIPFAPGGDTNYYQSSTYNLYLNTRASGIGLNLGMLYKLSDNWRIGASFNNPIRLKVTDRYIQSIASSYDFPIGNPAQKTYFVQNQDYDQDGNPDTSIYIYKLSTPSKLTGSIAYFFEKNGFISLDLERVNIANSKFYPFKDNYLFIEENTLIRKNYKSVLNVRLGAELVLDKYRFRAGYAYSPSAFKNDIYSNIKKLNRNTFTLGLGYIEKTYSLNGAIIINKFSEVYTPYQLYLNNNYYSADIKSTNVSVQFGISFQVN